MEQEVDRRLASQGGTVSRGQVLAAGLGDSHIEAKLRRREWAAVHRGVYVNHTGPLPWLQRAWAAVLYYSPAALSHESSLRAHGVRAVGEEAGGLIHVAVDQSRRVAEISGVRLHRVNDLDSLVQPNRSPARLRLEHSLLDAASAADRNSDAIAVIADACQRGRTTVQRLRATLQPRTNLPRRGFLMLVLSDVASGAHSVLEHRYLTRVERPHGLPTGKRQRRVRPGRRAAYRDVEYLGLATIVELDGRLGHEEVGDHWDDMDRDLDSAVAGDLTIRAGWRHVEDACRTAQAVSRVLRARGWQDWPTPCSEVCSVSARRREA